MDLYRVDQPRQTGGGGMSAGHGGLVARPGSRPRLPVLAPDAGRGGCRHVSARRISCGTAATVARGSWPTARGADPGRPRARRPAALSTHGPRRDPHTAKAALRNDIWVHAVGTHEPAASRRARRTARWAGKGAGDRLLAAGSSPGTRADPARSTTRRTPSPHPRNAVMTGSTTSRHSPPTVNTVLVGMTRHQAAAFGSWVVVVATDGTRQAVPLVTTAATAA
jgi:hypothetical protein